MSMMKSLPLEGEPNKAKRWLLAALPNAVTILALWAGLSGLTFVADGDFERAIGCVLAAALLDACDGRVARMTGTASRFGAELDSLSDVVCFGAVPAFILYSWGLSTFGAGGWLVCLMLAAATALRLARFNVAASASVARPVWLSAFFTGVPAPAGAFLALLPIYVANAGVFGLEGARLFALVAVPVVAGLMVSRIPTFSGKALGRMASRRWFIPSLAAGVAVTGLALVDFWVAAALAAAAYLVTFPFSQARHDRLARRAEASKSP